MCDKDWSEFSSAKTYYKSCGDNRPDKYDINDFKKNMKKIKKELDILNIYLLYIQWVGVGNDHSFAVEEAYNMMKYLHKDMTFNDIFTGLKIIYTEDSIYNLKKTGKIVFLLDSYPKTTLEKKKDLEMHKQLLDIFSKYFPKKNLKINNNASLTLKL